MLRALRCKRPELELERVILHQDNAPAHRAKLTTLEIDVLGFQTIEHAPYSPDLAPMDFRVFPTVKSALKGRKFGSFDELSYAAQHVVSQFEEQWYKDTFQQWIQRCQRCIDCSGDYFEKE